MRNVISKINLAICGVCLILILADWLFPEQLLFSEDPAKIAALVACVSTFFTSAMLIAENRRKGRRRKKARR